MQPDAQPSNSLSRVAAQLPNFYKYGVPNVLPCLCLSCRFLTVCQDGIACYWSSKMTITQRMKLDSNQRKINKASKSALRILDAAFMANAQRICVSTNARDIRFHHAMSGEITHKLNVPEMVMSLGVTTVDSDPDLCLLAARQSQIT